MPALERPHPVDGRLGASGQPTNERRHREAMARNRSAQGLDSQTLDSPGHGDGQSRAWNDADWDGDQDDADGRRARRLLSKSNSSLHRVIDTLSTLQRWGAGSGWVKRLGVALAVLLVIFTTSFGVVWWLLGAGPINVDFFTPWLVAAIEDNIGHGNTVEVGGTQIERAGRIRIAVRIRDIIVRDQDHAIVASAPKAEVRLSGNALLMGRLRAESLNLVDAVLAIRITPDGNVTVSTGDTAKPLATGVTRKSPAGAPPAAGSVPGGVAQQPAPATGSSNTGPSGLLAGLDWLDSLSLTGLDGQNLNEIGLKNGVLVVDDQQRGNKWTFDNISLSLRRPHGGGVVLSVGEEGKRAWSLRVVVGPPENGVRTVDVRADKLRTSNILLALRLKDMTYNADLPLSGEVKGEISRDGLPTYLHGKLTVGPGTIIDTDTPDYPMAIDQAEMSLEWDANRRVLVAPFKVVSGANRVTLLAHLEPPNDSVQDWQLGFSGGTILLGGINDEPPLIFNRIAVGFRFDTVGKRVLLTQADFSNGEIGVAGTGSIDYAGEPRLKLGFAGTPMSATALKRIWPALIVPEVREWIVDRIERGAVQRLDVAVNSPVKNLPRKGPPIPDDGLEVNIVASGVVVHPVDRLPSVRDADLKVHITGRTATVTIGQGIADTPGGRKLTLSDFLFEVPDMAPKPMQARVKVRVDGSVPAAAEIMASDRLSDLSATPIDPAASNGKLSAIITMGLPLKGELTKVDTTYNVNADLTGFSADKLVMNQKLEADTLKIVASNQGYQVKGGVKINGQPATLDYRKPADGDADIKLVATLDDASRARLGLDLGAAATGNVPIKLSGKIASGDHDSRVGVDADLTALKLDNVLPGWVKLPGKTTRATFNVVPKAQSTRFEDIVIDGGGTSIKGSLEVDQNGDLMNANFPVYSPSDGDKTQLKAERGADGVLKVTMRGDVFDGRGFLDSVKAGNSKDADSKSKVKSTDVDVDLKFGAVKGANGEALRSVDSKLSRRNGAFRSFTLTGKIGKDTPIVADLGRIGRDTPTAAELRGRWQGREVVLVETKDAGAFFRFADIYTKVIGGQLQLVMDPPSNDAGAREGSIEVRDFAVKGEAAIDRQVAGSGNSQNGVSFSRAHADFVSQSGRLTVSEAVLKGPIIGGTIGGYIDYPANQVQMSGTFIPAYGLNNLPAQIPLFGLFLGGGSNEGVIGVTFQVVGTPSKPDVRINPLSAIMPGVLRKIMEFPTGKQYNQLDFPQPNNNGN
ncbi:MAG: hypothetical protein JO052_24060 [Bradyrhizobium sp.]|nr:hypothetical protein [Bradyrhizobium sp.]